MNTLLAMSISRTSRVTTYVLGTAAVLIVLSGCSTYRYNVYPALSLSDRLASPAENRRGAPDWWAESYASKVTIIEENEWHPSSEELSNSLDHTAPEYGVDKCSTKELLPAAKKLFAETFRIDKENSKSSASSNVMGTVMQADREHPNLLVSKAKYEDMQSTMGSVFGSVLNWLPSLNEKGQSFVPSLVSDQCPVGVAITKWTTPEPKEEKSAAAVTTTVVVADAFFGPLYTSEGKKADSDANNHSVKIDQAGGSPTQEEKAEKPAIKDFETEQTFTLSLSTVLNSPSILDRIEYVSTYVWIEAFPFPPDGDVVLEEEFWHKFFCLNAFRDTNVLSRTQTTTCDMRRAIDDMRVRLVDMTTTVNPKMINLGQLMRTENDTFNSSVQGSFGMPVVPAASITPSVSYKHETGSSLTQTLQQELDQRATYVDPKGHFLRITQRGMQTANLGGRFLEKITLHIPAAEGTVPVIVPKDGQNYDLQWVSRPLYSRVDALTFSVVVARRTTALAKTTKDAYRQQDPSEAAFVVGVTRPDRVTLWQYDRRLDQVIARDVNNSESKTPSRVLPFAPDPSVANFYPFTLGGFTPGRKIVLLKQLREALGTNSMDGVSFSFVTAKNGSGDSIQCQPRRDLEQPPISTGPTVKHTRGIPMGRQ